MPTNPQDVQYAAREILAWSLILLGTFFLAKSVVATGQKWAMKELLGIRTDKLKTFRNHITQRLEAGFGFLFVLAGVGIHVYVLLRKYQERHVAETWEKIALYVGITVVVMALLALLFHLVCEWIAKRAFLEILAYLVVRYRYRIEDDQDLLKQIGELVKVEHREDDTVETYAARVEDRLGLDRVKARLAKKHKPIELG